MTQKKAFVVERAQSRTNEPLNVLGDIIHVKLSGADTERAYAMMEDTTEPQAGPPLHRHHREDNSFYVLEGQYRFAVDGQEIKAGPGTFENDFMCLFNSTAPVSMRIAAWHGEDSATVVDTKSI